MRICVGVGIMEVTGPCCPWCALMSSLLSLARPAHTHRDPRPLPNTLTSHSHTSPHLFLVASSTFPSHDVRLIPVVDILLLLRAVACFRSVGLFYLDHDNGGPDPKRARTKGAKIRSVYSPESCVTPHHTRTVTVTEAPQP